MKNSSHFKNEILDCTIRDGGYLNNWNFDKKVVKEICRSLSRTGVDIIEIGFKNRLKDGAGIWHSVPESLIEEIFRGISGIKIAVMFDFLKGDLSLVPEAKNSLVDMYRIACNRDKVYEAIKLSEKIKDRGYLTSLQLMGIGGYTKEDFCELIKPLSNSSIDYVYFADTYGSLFPRDIKRYIDLLRESNKKIGFHAHNSLQLAFANTLEAINCDVDIVDGTVGGIGRGAGNLPLEVLIIYLEKTLNNKKYNSMPLLDLIDRYFIDFKNELGWGYSLPYMLSGILEVHPDYAKHLAAYREHNVDDMVKILEMIKGLGPVGFNREIMDKVIGSGFVSLAHDLQDSAREDEKSEQILANHPVAYKDRHEGKDFLILANGPTLKEYKSEIEKFIKKYNPIVMGANNLGGLYTPHYHAFSNKRRFVSYIDYVDKESSLLISSSFENDFIRTYTDRDYEEIAHINCVSKDFYLKDGVISSNCGNISMLLIAVAIVMGAKRIFVAGMDGYKNKEDFFSNSTHFYKESEVPQNFKILMEKHNLSENFLKIINSFLIGQNKETLHIVTPTSHNLFYSSIYNWLK